MTELQQMKTLFDNLGIEYDEDLISPLRSGGHPSIRIGGSAILFVVETGKFLAYYDYDYGDWHERIERGAK
jgi:hypothetical protein